MCATAEQLYNRERHNGAEHNYGVGARGKIYLEEVLYMKVMHIAKIKPFYHSKLNQNFETITLCLENFQPLSPCV